MDYFQRYSYLSNDANQINPLIPISDQDRIFPYNINTISTT